MNKTSVSLYPLSRGMVFCGFVLLCMALSSRAFAEKPPQLATAATTGSPAGSQPGDTSRVSPGALQPQASPAAPPAGQSAAATLLVPEGFVSRRLERGQSLSKLCAEDSLCQVLFMKVNRIDRRHIPAGKTVLLPVDTERASQYVPVPEQLTDSRGEREIRVFLSRQYFGAYEWGKLVFWGPISSGRKTYATPPGKFFVNYKQRHKRSIKYDNAPMPYSINYYGGYFMHQQSLPGYPASHGCVRLLMTDAEKLFNWVRVRDAVTVVNNGGV